MKGNTMCKFFNNFKGNTILNLFKNGEQLVRNLLILIVAVSLQLVPVMAQNPTV